MRIANILSGIAIAAWFGLILLGRSLVKGIINQHVLGYPAIDQIDFLMLWPAVVILIVLLSAWAINGAQRWPKLLATISGIALLALLPYLFVYGGGV